MERDLKVLLTVDGNSYKITIKTRGFVNAVPFSEFKLFLDDKHRQLFQDINYVWKIYDADFGEYVSLQNASMIYDMSKIKASKEDINPRLNAVKFERNQQPQATNYPILNQRRDIQPQLQPQIPPLQRPSPQIDLRDFVSGFNRTPNPVSNSFDSYYPNRMPSVSNVTQNIMPATSNVHVNPNVMPMGPAFISHDNPMNLEYRRNSPPPLNIQRDINYLSPNNFNSPLNYQQNIHRTPIPLATYPDVSYRRDIESRESESLLYRMSQSLHDSFSHKRRSSPEPSRSSSSSNRNRVLSTPLYLKKLAERRKSSERRKSPLRSTPKLMKPSSPIRDRSKKLTEASKRLLRQHLTSSPPKRKLPNVVKPSVSKESKSSSQVTKPVPNCIRMLHGKVRDYFKIEDKKMGKAVINAVKKYNDEFKTLAMCEDIWETDRIWTYVAKEVISSNEIRVKPNRKAVRCRRYFRGMLRRYLIILEDFWNWSEFEAQELWPFFDFFHKQLDLTPFDKDVTRLKECFAQKMKPTKDTTKETKNKSESVNKSKKKTERKEFVFDDKYDVRLLMAVSEHIEDFKKDTILESDVWTEVAVDLNDPKILDSTLLEKSRIKWETRFYKLLSEFQLLAKKDTPLSSSERTLKFLFEKLDVSPFIKEENDSGDESDASEELDREMLVVAEEVTNNEPEQTDQPPANNSQEDKIQSLMNMINESKEKSVTEVSIKEDEKMEVDKDLSVCEKTDTTIVNEEKDYTSTQTDDPMVVTKEENEVEGTCDANEKEEVKDTSMTNVLELKTENKTENVENETNKKSEDIKEQEKVVESKQVNEPGAAVDGKDENDSVFVAESEENEEPSLTIADENDSDVKSYEKAVDGISESVNIVAKETKHESDLKESEASVETDAETITPD